VTLKTSNDEEHEVIRDGKLVREDFWFFRRIFDSEHGIEIDPVERRDSGTLEFRDQDGNLALAVILNLIPGKHCYVLSYERKTTGEPNSYNPIH